MSMNWNKTATKILEEIDSIDVRKTDLDNVAYYMTHLSSPTMWERVIDFGEALVYHGRNAQSTTVKHEGEQLWLTFDE
jgi:hypothetical protein